MCLESNPIPTRMLRGLKQTLFAPGPRDPTETETELYLSVSCGGTDQHGSAQGQGSGYSRPGCGISLPGGSFHYPHHRATRTYTGLGKQTLGLYLIDRVPEDLWMEICDFVQEAAIKTTSMKQKCKNAK